MQRRVPKNRQRQHTRPETRLPNKRHIQQHTRTLTCLPPTITGNKTTYTPRDTYPPRNTGISQHTGANARTPLQSEITHTHADAPAHPQSQKPTHKHADGLPTESQATTRRYAEAILLTITGNNTRTQPRLPTRNYRRLHMHTDVRTRPHKANPPTQTRLPTNNHG